MRRLRSPGFEWLRQWIRTPSPHKAWLGSRSRRERSDSGWDTCFPLSIISWTGGTGLSSASAGHDYLKREPPECVGRVITMQYATHAPSRADTFPRNDGFTETTSPVVAVLTKAPIKHTQHLTRTSCSFRDILVSQWVN